MHRGETSVNCELATAVQIMNIEQCLAVGRVYMKLAGIAKQSDSVRRYKARAFACLARACELEEGISIADSYWKLYGPDSSKDSISLPNKVIFS